MYDEAYGFSVTEEVVDLVLVDLHVRSCNRGTDVLGDSTVEDFLGWYVEVDSVSHSTDDIPGQLGG